MIKIYCDRCGEEIKFGWKGCGKEWADKIEFNKDKFHICPKCYNSFIEWRDAVHAKSEGGENEGK